MIKVGITGGIGSGKTTVCKIFEVLGVPVYYADDRAKELITSDAVLIKKIKKLLGDDAYDANNNINKKRISAIVFNFPDVLEKYNAIVHPAVHEDAEKWMRRHQQFDYVVEEAALLFETGTYKKLDTIICVTAPIEVRIERIKKRDNLTISEIESRLENQMPEEEKILLSDFVIHNDGSTPLIRQVLRIHEKILEKKENLFT